MGTLDTNVIIESFRTGCWSASCEHYAIETVEKCIEEVMTDDPADLRRYLVEIRPQLHMLPNTIDIEADDLLGAKKVNREILLRRQLKPVLPDLDVVVIDTPPAMRAATVNTLVVANSKEVLAVPDG